MAAQTRRTAVILTALGLEYNAVRSHIGNLKEQTDACGTVYEVGEFVAGDTLWTVSIVEIGPGNPSASAQTERAINLFRPDVAMFVGVRGGLKDVSIGDVVAATKVYGYEFGKAKVEFETRPEVVSSSYDMQQQSPFSPNTSR